VIVDDAEYRFPEPDSRMNPPWPMVTMVFQQLFLWPHMTMQQNILLPVQKRGITAADRDLFDQLAKTFRLDKVLDKYPNQASLGERQRVALSRALFLRPRYLLLDEITSAQDVEYVQVILKHLQGLKSAGVGLLFVTHMLGFAGRLADQVQFLDNGEVVESGPVSILSSPQTERMNRFVSLIEYLKH
jgi:ABC-type polar amino acid transport system ATPase subunit